MGNTGIDKISFNHLPIGNMTVGNSRKTNKQELPIDAVDKVADELVRDYSNPDYRRWYCGVIYDFGFDKVEEWRRRAAEGKEPAKLFSKYVKDARTYKPLRGLNSEPVNIDDIEI